VDQDPLAGFQTGVVEQHVLDRRVGDRDAGGVAQVDAYRDRKRQACGVGGDLLREAVEMEAAHTAWILAQILDALAAEPAFSAGDRGVGHDMIARREAVDALAHRDDLARGLGRHGQRKTALGEGHAAHAPQVDVVESDIAHAQQQLARTRSDGSFNHPHGDFTLGQKLQRANAHSGAAPMTRATFWPPKPKELDMACVTLASRATFGTQSTGRAGSGAS